MKKKLTYEAPEGELILVRFEENFLDSPTPDGFGNPNETTPFSYRDGGSF